MPEGSLPQTLSRYYSRYDHTVYCEPAMSRQLMVPTCVPARDFCHLEVELFLGGYHRPVPTISAKTG